jgi:hypothetical protein
MLNLWIGLCRGLPELPGVIHELGYREKSIEPTIRTDGGALVNPELVTASHSLRHTLLCEWKSGRGVDLEQATRYATVTREALRRARIDPESCENHDVLYVVDEPFAENIRTVLQEHGCTFPVISKSEQGLTRISNEFQPPQLNDAFGPTLELDWDTAPTMFVPLDGDSEPWEIALVSMPEVFAFLQERAPEVDSQSVTSRAFGRIWPFLDVTARAGMQTKVETVLRMACEGEFHHVLRPARAGHYSRLVVKFNPFFAKQASKKLQNVNDLLAHFVAVLQGNEPQQLVIPAGEELEIEGFAGDVDIRGR